MQYLNLVTVYEQLDSTTKRLEKTYYVARLLERTKPEDIAHIVLLLEGKLYPAWDERKIGVASQLLVKAISLATGSSTTSVEHEWKKTGDLGKVAENLITGKKQRTLASSDLTVEKVFTNLRKLTEMEGTGSVERKLQLIAELLTSATPLEARYITRTILEDLRVGVGSGSMRDAIVWAFFPKIQGVFFKCSSCKSWNPNTAKCIVCGKPLDGVIKEKLKEKNVLEISEIPDLKKLHEYSLIIPDSDTLARELYNLILEKVQQAYDLTNDWAKVASVAKSKGIPGLELIEMTIGVPIKVMLALKVDTIDDGFERTGKPAAAEFKYDGFRIQAHKSGKNIWLFTRRLENVTKQFPDVVDFVKNQVKGDNFILDSEAVGYDPKTKKYLPFQSISQRIKRKYDIEKTAKDFPVEVNVFDIIAYEKKNLIVEPFHKRRELLGKIITPAEKKIVLAKHIISSDKKEIEEFFNKSLAAGNEGIMMKKLDAPYKPGARVGYMVKFKPTMETLDLVIIRAEWGEGKRATWLSSYTLACRKGKELLEVGKVSTGVKEKEEEGVSYDQLTEMLRPLIIKGEGKEVIVKPKIVIEVKFEEIQQSPTYSSGYALRFPRFVRLREDRGPHDCSTIEDVERLYSGQKKAK